MSFHFSNDSTQFKVMSFSYACVYIVNSVSAANMGQLAFHVLQGRPRNTEEALALLQGKHVVLDLENQGFALAKGTEMLTRQ